MFGTLVRWYRPPSKGFPLTHMILETEKVHVHVCTLLQLLPLERYMYANHLTHSVCTPTQYYMYVNT